MTVNPNQKKYQTSIITKTRSTPDHGIPVSYTHLDVYKRQDYMFSNMNKHMYCKLILNIIFFIKKLNLGVYMTPPHSVPKNGSHQLRVKELIVNHESLIGSMIHSSLQIVISEKIKHHIKIDVPCLLKNRVTGSKTHSTVSLPSECSVSFFNRSKSLILQIQLRIEQ